MLRFDNRISLPAGVSARASRSSATAGPVGWPVTQPIVWLAAVALCWALVALHPANAHAASHGARRQSRHRHGGHDKHRHKHSKRRVAHTKHHTSGAPVLLGDTAVEPLHYSLAPGRSEAFRLRARASGPIGSLRLYVGSGSTARNVVVGLYSDTRGRPGKLLASGATAAHRGWSAVALTPTPGVTAGGHYWLTILAEGGTLNYRARRHSRCARALSVHANLDSLPATASAVRISRHARCPISAYATAASNGAPVELTAPIVVASPPGSDPLSPSALLGSASSLVTAAKSESAKPGQATSESKPGEKEPEGPHEKEQEKERGHEEEPSSKEPAPAAPANSVSPTVGGTLIEGDVLTSTRGTWSEAPTSYAYRWQDCNAAGNECKAIAAATAASYTLAATDVKHTIRVVVTAKNAAGSTPASSAATGLVTAAPPPPPPTAPTNTKAPTISGTATEGQALTAGNGAWSGSPSSYSYHWQDCDTAGTSCTNITGATAASYTLAAGDVGHTIRVVVTATNAGGSTAASSAQSAIVAAYSSESTYPACTQTIGTAANISSTVSGAAAGAVICLSSGAYGNINLNATHSSDVTLQAAPAAHATASGVSISGSHLVVRGLWVDGQVALEEGTSFVTIDHDDISNEGGNGGEGIVFDTSDCTVPNAPTWSGCEPHAPISNVTISHNHIHGIGQEGSEDAIHLDNWRNVTVTGNEFDHIIESGNHTDCLQSVYGGENLTFTHNYEHDNDCQGIFIKDGDAKNVAFTDNLFLRDTEGSYADFAQLWNIEGLTIEHDTIWDGKGLALVTEDASFTPTVTMDHNVISNMSVEPHSGTPYSITEDDDIFGEAPNKLTEGSGDSTVANPKFTNTATDDYRLASNPNGIGIDWSPAAQQYGPES